jgi:hypothetical protein
MRRADGSVAYAMVQLWLANASSQDAKQVTARLHWRRRHGSSFQQEERPGLWLRKVGSEMASHTGPTERIALRSNGEEEHLGLLAKVRDHPDAYIVAPGSYHAGPQFPNYQHPSFRLPPGEYDVDVALRARGGKTQTIKLLVVQPGVGGDPSAALR